MDINFCDSFINYDKNSSGIDKAIVGVFKTPIIIHRTVYERSKVVLVYNPSYVNVSNLIYQI